MGSHVPFVQNQPPRFSLLCGFAHSCWRHAELQMEQHFKEMRQIRQSHGTRLQVVCSTYIYLRDQQDKGFLSYKIEHKMNKEIGSELETQGHLLENMRAEMESFKGTALLLVEGNYLSRWCVSIVACQGSTREEISFDSGKISPKLKQEKKG
jgi:hypothetical protein